MIILAETVPTPSQFSGFVVTGAFLLSLGVNVVTIFVATRKQRREVTFGFEPASHAEFVKHMDDNRREHENLFSKIGGVERGQNLRFEEKFTAMNKDANDSREKLHDRINQVLRAVSRLEGKIGGTSD